VGLTQCQANWSLNRKGPRIFGETSSQTFLVLLEDLGDDDIALGPHLEEKTCVRFRSVGRCCPRGLQDLLVLQGTTKSTRKKSQDLFAFIKGSSHKRYPLICISFVCWEVKKFVLSNMYNLLISCFFSSKNWVLAWKKISTFSR